MTTPTQAPVMSREEWETEFDEAAEAYAYENERWVRFRTLTIDSIMALQSEVERLRAIVSEVHSMAVQADIRSGFVPAEFIRSAIEKARQPK